MIDFKETQTLKRVEEHNQYQRRSFSEKQENHEKPEDHRCESVKLEQNCELTDKLPTIMKLENISNQ